MRSDVLARIVATTIALVLATSGCGVLEEPDTAWTSDEDAVAERLAADEALATADVFTDRIIGLGALDRDIATCVVDQVIEARGDAAVAEIVDVNTDARHLTSPLASAVVSCGAGDDLASQWIPEVDVELRPLATPLACVDDEAASWAADRFAEVLVAGGLEAEESVVDQTWLGRVVDRCDAGAAMMAADAVLVPRVGADARTPSRWVCAASKAPAGTFDQLLDPTVTGDAARLETVESRVARWFEDCA